MMRKINWIEILKEISKSNAVQSPISYNGKIYSFQISEYEDSGMGSMTIWETDSLRALYISRMEIPNNAERMVMGDKNSDREIPHNLKFEDLNGNTI